MTHKEIKLKVLKRLWCWATTECEGYETGELSDVLEQDVLDGRYTEKEAKKIQKEMFKESERMWKRLKKLKTYNHEKTR